MFKVWHSPKLNLGCGDKLLRGYLNVDVAPSRKGSRPDLLADLRSLPFKENSISEILSVHVIEHFYYWEVTDLLVHWYKLLEPGGKLILECPNLMSAALALIEDESLASDISDKRGQYVMWPLYGDPSWQDELMCHRWGYTPTSLKSVVTTCGFRDAIQMPAEFKRRDPRDMRIVGTK